MLLRRRRTSLFRVRRTPYTHGRTTEEVVLLTRSEWTRLITPLGEFAPSKRPRRGAGEVVYTVEHRPPQKDGDGFGMKH